MLLDTATCYEALRARDRRFDGVFFVAVRTTGVYCRPICPARTPGRDRCEFFGQPAEAERAGYRACFRCRPEVAPGHASTEAIAGHVRAALARIEGGYLNEHSVDELARLVGVTARHLRRAMETEVGVTPIELAQTRRLAMAKRLLHDSRLPLTDVAFASGFSSVRRFNSAFRARFGRPPSDFRSEGDAISGSHAIRVRLDYRPPLAWEALLRFLAARAIPGCEEVDDGVYRRSVAFDRHEGVVSVRHTSGSLEATVPTNLASHLMELVYSLRGLFDLDARPDLIDACISDDPLLRSAVLRTPGLRVPGAMNGFELAVRAILGQQVSVAAARTLAGRLVHLFGVSLKDSVGGVTHRFPQAATLAAAGPEQIKRIGIPATRARTIVDLSAAFAEGRLLLSRAAPPEDAMRRLREIRGIGPWTAQYITMRALQWPDAFPAEDLVIRKVLGVSTAATAIARAQAWRPWRSYAVLHLWSLA